MRRTSRWALAIAIGGFLLTGSAARSDELTIEERVRAQEAIEQVFWDHRIWPAANPGPKPPPSAVISADAVRAKVHDSLAQSDALATIWGRPITRLMLHDELQRMAANTRDPDTLRELFAALGDDPALVRECLVRPILADRLARQFYARDAELHAAARSKAVAGRARLISVHDLARVGDGYEDDVWIRVDGASDASQAKPGVHSIESDVWTALIASLSERIGASNSLGLVPGTMSPVGEDDTSFFVVAILERSDDRIRTGTARWLKIPFDTWWSTAGRAISGAPAEKDRSLEFDDADVAPSSLLSSSSPSAGELPLITGFACTDDTWTPTKDGQAPDARLAHTAVWTGAEMIIWGGDDAEREGGRYTPATDSWTPVSTGAGLPSARNYHVAVWTGTEMIIWGGSSSYTNTGGRYNPATDTWTATSTGAGCPTGRWMHSAVWTGTEMIVWGGTGSGGGSLNTGGRYNPSTDAWTATSTGTNVPTARERHEAVWTGTQMIVWGGGFPVTNTGGRYNPSTDSWLPTSTGTSVPSARVYHTAVWTGSVMVIWGGTTTGSDAGNVNNGGRYNPSTDSWTTTLISGAPLARAKHSAVWTGSLMIVWGGTSILSSPFNTGGRYDVSANSWTATPISAVASARSDHSAVWTGTEMIIWGGIETDTYGLRTGARYDLAGNSWTATSLGPDAPAPRGLPSGTWTGTELIVWGGRLSFLYGGYTYMSDGWRYVPSTDTWSAISTTGVPEQRAQHTAIWTGTDMIVWGGYNDSFSGYWKNTGGLYNPTTNLWTATSTTGTPSARREHTAVWTGTDMVIWGGDAGGGWTNTGGLYNPGTNSWTATSTTGAPSGRREHSAVWTGSEMIVWGGFAGGGRYSPSTNFWSSMADEPSPPVNGRRAHAAVWTGTDMIVWGGYYFNSGTFYLASGARYNPGNDTWTATSTGPGVPSARRYHRGVWTGTEMIVWGGANPSFLSSGGRYDANTDSWRATSVMSAPVGRQYPTAAWTGSEMIVWGGEDNGALGTGGRYCATCSTRTWYADADEDGYGNPSSTVSSCDGPVGYVANGDDCNDGDGDMFPGNPEICDGKDNDCDGTTDNAPVPVGSPSLSLAKEGEEGATRVSWTVLSGSTGTDLLLGSLDTLRSSGGRFQDATQSCLTNDDPATSYLDSTPVAADSGVWYLARGINCGGGGNYDEGEPSQPETRDPEIALSPNRCP